MRREETKKESESGVKYLEGVLVSVTRPASENPYLLSTLILIAILLLTGCLGEIARESNVSAATLPKPAVSSTEIDNSVQNDLKARLAAARLRGEKVVFYGELDEQNNEILADILKNTVIVQYNLGPRGIAYSNGVIAKRTDEATGEGNKVDLLTTAHGPIQDRATIVGIRLFSSGGEPLNWEVLDPKFKVSEDSDQARLTLDRDDHPELPAGLASISDWTPQDDSRVVSAGLPSQGFGDSYSPIFPIAVGGEMHLVSGMGKGGAQKWWEAYPSGLGASGSGIGTRIGGETFWVGLVTGGNTISLKGMGKGVPGVATTSIY